MVLRDDRRSTAGDERVSALTEHRPAGDDPESDRTWAEAPPERGSDEESGEWEEVSGPHFVQDEPAPELADLRLDFGAHLEANYQRLVAQLYAITLDPGEAHDVVQDAYSRAWRNWRVIGRSPDPTGWVRRVAVRSTIRSWRRVAARFGLDRGARRRIGEIPDPRTRTVLSALGRLSPVERRAVVLTHMVGLPLNEIAALEQEAPGTVAARLSRARQMVSDGMADLLAAYGDVVVTGAGGEPGRVDGEGRM